MTLASLLRAAADRLDLASVSSPEHDALVLLAHHLGVATGELRVALARGDDIPAAFEDEPWAIVVGRRAAREPLQHIIGTAPFRSLELVVGPGVFVPRPETEVVAQVAIDGARVLGGSEVVVADLCAGSGAIGLAIASELPDALVTLVEISEQAFGYLERNLAALPLNVRARVELALDDARTALVGREGAFDVVVSNPPYVPPDASPRESEVADYDPAIALYGLGEDGLQVPRAVLARAAALLRPGGLFVMEHADTQGAAMRAAAYAAGVWHSIGTRQDLTGRDRMIVATRAAHDTLNP